MHTSTIEPLPAVWSRCKLSTFQKSTVQLPLRPTLLANIAWYMQRCTATAHTTTMAGTVMLGNHSKTSNLYLGAGVSLRGRAARKLGPLHLLGLDPLEGAHLPGLAHLATPLLPELGRGGGSRHAGLLGDPDTAGGGAGVLMGCGCWLSGGGGRRGGWDHGRLVCGKLL